MFKELYARPFVDSICFMSTFIAPSSNLTQVLRSAMAHGRIGNFHIGEPKGGQFFPKLHQPRDWDWVLKFVADQQWELIGVHVALDVGCPTINDAEALGEWANRHLDVPYRRGEQPTAVAAGTTYTNVKRAGVNAVVYTDRASKLTGEADCLHLEIRIRRKPAMRRFGIHRLADIPRVDLGKLFARAVRFVAWSPEQIGRLATGRGRAKRPLIRRFGSRGEINVDRRIGTMICRQGALGIRRACCTHGIDPARVFKVISPPWTVVPSDMREKLPCSPIHAPKRSKRASIKPMNPLPKRLTKARKTKAGSYVKRNAKR